MIDCSVGLQLTMDDATDCLEIAFNDHKQSASNSASNSCSGNQHSAASLYEQVPVNQMGKLIISMTWSFDFNSVCYCFYVLFDTVCWICGIDC